MSDFYSKKSDKLKDKEKRGLKLLQQEKEISRLLRKQAAQYINLRKRRFEQQVPTLNEFLLTVYKEIKTAYKEATQKLFPFENLGFGAMAKKNKSFIFHSEKSFPLSLKRYFFTIVRSFSRKTNIYRRREKLAFWAPPSINPKCIIHTMIDCPPGCKFYTLNFKVMQRSKRTREFELLFVKNKKRLWENPNFFNERLQFLLTFTEARECTFQPLLGFPDKYKRERMEKFGELGSKMNKKTNFEVPLFKSEMG